MTGSRIWRDRHSTGGSHGCINMPPDKWESFTTLSSIMFRSSVSIDRSEVKNKQSCAGDPVKFVLSRRKKIMFDQSFSFILTIAAQVGFMLTGHGSF